MFAHSFDQLNSAGAVTSPMFEARADPCSRETVLSVLRASRKRNDDEDDEDERAQEAGQKSKRRYLLENLHWLFAHTGSMNSFSQTEALLSLFCLL